MRRLTRDRDGSGRRPAGRSLRPVRPTLSALAAIGLVAGVAGCSDQIAGLKMDQPASVAVQDRYPIDVTRSPRTLRLNVSRRLSGLSHNQKARLNRFLYQFAERGAGKLRVSRPRGVPNQLMAGAAVAQIKQMIDRTGVPREKIILSVYRPANHKIDAPVVLSFIRYYAEVAPCGDWSTNLAVTYKNRPHPNFGCATQLNLAAMVAQPRDLLRPRKMTPPDAIRRDNALEHYRKGEVTSAQKSSDEKAEVSNVAK